MNESVSRHPPVETMAAFIEGRLTPAETAAVSEHLRACGECRTVVAETARFEEEETAAQPAVRTGKPWWILIAASVIVILALPLLLRRGSRDPIALLAGAAPKEHRRIDARVAGFAWAPYAPPQRGTGIADPADLKLNGAAGDVLERTAKKTDAASLHAQGVALLLIDRASDGMTALERAANASNDARIWNDLAAAEHALAVRDGRVALLPLALASADRAIRLDPQLAEAHFNRALILHDLGLLDQARKEWQVYLQLDPSSEWSLEARTRLRSLDGNKPSSDFRRAIDALPAAELVRQFPQESRTWGEGILLAEWADAEHAHDAAAARAKLQRARAIATALAAANGEHLLEDAVAAVEQADADARAALVDAHRAYRDGRVAFRNRKVAEAGTSLLRAEESVSPRA